MKTHDSTTPPPSPAAVRARRRRADLLNAAQMRGLQERLVARLLGRDPATAAEHLGTVRAFRDRVYVAAVTRFAWAEGDDHQRRLDRWAACRREPDGRDTSPDVRKGIGCGLRLCPNCWASHANRVRARVLACLAAYPRRVSDRVVLYRHAAVTVDVDVTLPTATTADLARAVRAGLAELHRDMQPHVRRLRADGGGLRAVRFHVARDGSLVLTGYTLGCQVARGSSPARRTRRRRQAERAGPAGRHAGPNEPAAVSRLLRRVLRVPQGLATLDPAVVWRLQGVLHGVGLYELVGGWATPDRGEHDDPRRHERLDPELVERLVAHARKHGGVLSARDVQNRAQAIAPNPAAALCVLRRMAEMGLGQITAHQPKPGRRGRPAGPRLELSQAIMARQHGDVLGDLVSAA